MSDEGPITIGEQLEQIEDELRAIKEILIELITAIGSEKKETTERPFRTPFPCKRCGVGLNETEFSIGLDLCVSCWGQKCTQAPCKNCGTIRQSKLSEREFHASSGLCLRCWEEKCIREKP